MKSVSFQLFILLVQIYLASKIECRSSDGQEFLIETESGEVFRSQPSKKDTEEAGHDYANDYDDGVITHLDFFAWLRKVKLCFVMEGIQLLKTW